MDKKNIGRDFLFSKEHGLSNDDGGNSCLFDDGSGFYHGSDGSEATMFSDGSGYYHGADGSEGTLFSDGSGYYRGADGSSGTKYSDGSGFFCDAHGNSESISAEDEDSASEDSPDAASTLSEALTDVLTAVGTAYINVYFEKRRQEREFARAQAEEQERRRAEKRQMRSVRNRAWRKKNKKSITVTVLVLVLACMIGIGCLELKMLIPTGCSSDELTGEKYTDVIERLESAGFASIRTDVVNDLHMDDADKENVVTNVKIAWFDSFEETARFPSNFPVIVTYHTLMTVPVPMSSKEAQKMDYLEALRAFKNAGFVGVTVEARYDIITGWITHDGEVDSITIDGNEQFDAGDEYRPDVQILITYHTWKKDKPDNP